MIVFILPLLCFLLGYVIARTKKLTAKRDATEKSEDKQLSKLNKILALLLGLAKVIFWMIYISLIFKVILVPVINEYNPLGPIHTDVAKRISSPDYTKTALLIRRNAFDLNYAVRIQEGQMGFDIKTLHWTRDFLPNIRVNWDEELIWSYDSSILVMSVDNEFDEEEKYMWAYDFKDNKEYKDEILITEILNTRNEGKENPEDVFYK